MFPKDKIELGLATWEKSFFSTVQILQKENQIKFDIWHLT